MNRKLRRFAERLMVDRCQVADCNCAALIHGMTSCELTACPFNFRGYSNTVP